MIIEIVQSLWCTPISFKFKQNTALKFNIKIEFTLSGVRESFAQSKRNTINRRANEFDPASICLDRERSVSTASMSTLVECRINNICNLDLLFFYIKLPVDYFLEIKVLCFMYFQYLQLKWCNHRWNLSNLSTYLKKNYSWPKSALMLRENVAQDGLKFEIKIIINNLKLI